MTKIQSKQQKQLRLNKYTLVSLLLSEEKEEKGLTESQVAEAIFMDYFMPKFCFQVIADLYEGNINFNQALQNILIASLELEVSNRQKIKPIIVLIRKRLVISDAWIKRESESYHILMLQLDSVLHFFEKQCTLYPENYKLKEELVYLQQLVERYFKNEDDFNSSVVLALILENWSWLCSYDLVFHMIENMLGMLSEIKVTLEARSELRKILKEIK